MAEHKTLAAALAAFQTELPKLTKDEKAKVKGETKDGRSYDRSYGYADLAQVVETVLPVLGKHGLSVTSKTALTDGNLSLEVSLLHESGERESAFWPMPDPRRAGPQDIGSAMTYGRRYLTLALTGAYPGGEDDDGQQAQTRARESWDSATPSRPAQNRPVSAPPAEPAPAKTSWTDAEIANYQAKIASDPDLERAVKGYDWMASKALHNREVENGSECKTATATLAVRLATEALRASSTLQDIEAVRAIAVDRGLTKVPVSATESLEEAIHTARELAAHAAVEQAKADTPDPQAE
jgi:hypothetical protein